MLGAPYFVRKRLSRPKFGDAAQGRLANRRHGFTREKCLMTRHDDVREGDQTLKCVVDNDGAGKIAKEKVCLLLVHVERQSCQLPALECLDRRIGVDQSAATR